MRQHNFMIDGFSPEESDHSDSLATSMSFENLEIYIKSMSGALDDAKRNFPDAYKIMFISVLFSGAFHNSFICG